LYIPLSGIKYVNAFYINLIICAGGVFSNNFILSFERFIGEYQQKSDAMQEARRRIAQKIDVKDN
jgi:hypothetical protein